jgi:hypothetical protein
MIYYLVIILLSIFSFLNLSSIDRKTVKINRFLAFGLIILIGGLRYKVGADWGMYEYLFDDINSLSDIFDKREEKLYVFFNYLLKQVYNNYSFFIFILFSFSFSLKYYIIKLYSPDVFLSLMIYIFGVFLIYDLNGLRQGMAMAFVLLSIPLIVNNKFFYFLLIVMIGSLFHVSAIIFLPFYFLAKIKISNKKIIFILVCSIILAIPIRALVANSSALQLILELSTFSHYSTYNDEETYRVNTSILSIALLQRIIILVLFLYNYKRIKIKSNIKVLLRNGYFISIVLFVLLSFNGQFAARLSFYYKNLDILMVPLIVYSIRNKSVKLFVFIFFLIFCLLGTYRLINIPNGYLIPYDNLLNYIL